MIALRNRRRTPPSSAKELRALTTQPPMWHVPLCPSAGQHESLCASVQETIADSYLLHVGHGPHHHSHTHTQSYGDGLS
eukprot:8368-Eustigmatos_ZCMA.PRE.1